MNCAWELYLALLPNWLRPQVDQVGCENLQELRLRLGHQPEMILLNGIKRLDRLVVRDDLEQCIRFASKYSPWSLNTVSKGYITGPGGHRIGICGSFVYNSELIPVLQSPGMLNLRVARDFVDIAPEPHESLGSILILGKPGSGKTTLLRDLIRKRAKCHADMISVVDEREEICPLVNGDYCFPFDGQVDILSGCKKSHGIEMALRNMTPSIIATDEITATEDCEALIHAGWCGVKLYATAHAGCAEDLYARPVYRPIVTSGIFQTLVIMQEDKSWYTERMRV